MSWFKRRGVWCLRVLLSLSCAAAVFLAYATPLDDRGDGVGHVPFLELDARVVGQRRKEVASPGDIMLDGVLWAALPMAALSLCLPIGPGWSVLLVAAYFHVCVFPKARDHALAVADSVDEYLQILVQIGRCQASLTVGTLLLLAVDPIFPRGDAGVPLLFGSVIPRTGRSGGRSHTSRVRIGDSPFAVVQSGDLVAIFWGTVPLYSFRESDRLGRYVAAVDLVRHHELPVRAVAKAIGVEERTIFRLLKRFDAGGVEALLGRKRGKSPGKPKSFRVRAQQQLKRKRQRVTSPDATGPQDVSRLTEPTAQRPPEPTREGPEAEGSEPRQEPVSGSVPAAVSAGSHAESGAIAVSAPATDLARVDDVATEATQPAVNPLPVTVTTPPQPVSLDLDPRNRFVDRLLARLGLLDDAAPMFTPGVVPGAGVLLVVPLLVRSGLFEIAAKVYGSLGPAFYGLRTSMLTLSLMALLRIKRAENLKEDLPEHLGRVLGLDRAPELKTVRWKVEELAERKKSLKFMLLLAEKYHKDHPGASAYLYVDGHVRVYNGKAKIVKTYVMQRHLAMPGTLDYWVNDQDGQPLLVITSDANEGLTKMLKPVLKHVRTVIGDTRATIVFDRGGWSPKLFQELIADKWDILTYRKGKTKKVPIRAFEEHSAEIDGRDATYKLATKRVRFLDGKLSLRQITVLGDDGYQTNILTSKEGVPAVDLVVRMFDRWRQENYFKYMKQEYALDALVDYGTEAADPDRMVPNPKRKAIDKELKVARAELAALERQYGAAAFDNKEDKRPTARGFKIANGAAIGKPLRNAREKVQSILDRRKGIPTRVTITEALKDKPFRLRTERKRLTDTLKMNAYRAETALVDLLRPHYHRTDDEGRKLIVSALKSSAELQVGKDELCVVVAPQSSAHRSRALHAVCCELTKMGVCFPGTSLRLRFEVSGVDLSPEQRQA